MTTFVIGDDHLRVDVEGSGRVAVRAEMVKPGTKTGPERVVPLTRRALRCLQLAPPQIDTPILFPASRGGYIELQVWRMRESSPALRAAGINHRRIYDLRHTFATCAIARGVPTL